MKGTLKLKDMRFYAYHGVHEHESHIGTLFVVHLSLSFALTQELKEGHLSDKGLNYEKIYDWLKKKFSRSRYILLEQATTHLAKGLMARFSDIETLTLYVEKKVRKTASEAFCASFELHMDRSSHQ